SANELRHAFLTAAVLPRHGGTAADAVRLHALFLTDPLDHDMTSGSRFREAEASQFLRGRGRGITPDVFSDFDQAVDLPESLDEVVADRSVLFAAVTLFGLHVEGWAVGA